MSAVRRFSTMSMATWNKPLEHSTRSLDHALTDGKSPPSVLLVGLSDDERQIFGGFLQRLGFVVQAFAEAERALTAATRTPPAAIVTRIIQRGPMDGIELTRRVRADPVTGDVAVVVVTTRIEPAFGAAALEAGCDAFLLLPASAELVAYEVERGIVSRGARARKRLPAAAIDD